MWGMDIASIRKDMKLTQAQFAEGLGISHAYVGHLETGHRKLSIKVAAKIEKFSGKKGFVAQVVAEKTADA